MGRCKIGIIASFFAGNREEAGGERLAQALGQGGNVEQELGDDLDGAIAGKRNGIETCATDG